MKSPRKKDPMQEMRARYERATEAERDSRTLALDDMRFLTIPGNQWDDAQRRARKGRPCYEFPVLRSHWRQVVNDQKKARPGIKVRAVEDGDAKGAELRQGIIRNIESVSNAERAYDAAFESVTACGFGAWRVVTENSTDDAWDLDLRVKRINDPLTSAWHDPDAKEPDLRDALYWFLEETISRELFAERYPKADAVDFESAQQAGVSDWYGEKGVRIAEYWRMVPEEKTLLLLSDGRTVDKAKLNEETVQRLMDDGITVARERQVHGKKVVMSIVAGTEEIDGPHDSVFSRIPIVACYANRHFIDGKWTWAGMVRFSRDPQRLVNYNLTTAQEVLGKQHKATPVVTPKMLEGAGVRAIWDSSNAIDVPYLPFTPDPLMPGGPQYLSPPPVHAAFAQMGQMAIDMLKSATGIQDASMGARSNETSGRAILARQAEGDTATYDYQDALGFAIQTTGELILSALPSVYDTPRALRVLGKDGAEDWVQLYEEVQNPQPGEPKVINDLSAGKYDVTITTGASYETRRMEFVDMLTQLGQNNPAIAAGVPDLIVASLDFPKADEAAERLKLMLPPQVQQALQQKDETPALVQLKSQMQQMQQQAEEYIGQMQEQMKQIQAKADSKEALIAREYNVVEDRKIAWYQAETARLAVLQKDGHANDATQLAALKVMQADTHNMGHMMQADTQHADKMAGQAEQTGHMGQIEQAEPQW